MVVIVRARSKQPSFDLIPVDGPGRVGVLLSPVEFQVRTGTDALDQGSEGERLAAMNGPLRRKPASAGAVAEGKFTANAQQ